MDIVSPVSAGSEVMSWRVQALQAAEKLTFERKTHIRARIEGYGLQPVHFKSNEMSGALAPEGRFSGPLALPSEFFRSLFGSLW
jgi:hypothetical protein